MRREGRLGGKPTNHSRMTGKCKVVGCQACHESLPLNKSRAKGKGRTKRLVSDIPSTHLISDWRVTKPSMVSSRKTGTAPKWDTDEDDLEATGGNEREGWALSISLLLDVALEHIQESVDAKSALQKAEEEASDGGQEGRAPRSTEHTDDKNADENPDFQSFSKVLEVFKTEIEAGGSPTSVAVSLDSSAGFELSDADESDLSDLEGDWLLVPTAGRASSSQMPTRVTSAIGRAIGRTIGLW